MFWCGLVVPTLSVRGARRSNEMNRTLSNLPPRVISLVQIYTGAQPAPLDPAALGDLLAAASEELGEDGPQALTTEQCLELCKQTMPGV